jgi:hypothetical protein
MESGYKEKAPPRRKAPVRRPRVKKDPEPTITTLITPAQRRAIRAGQAKLIAETEQASATAIQRAIRSNLARKAVKNTRASNAMNTAGDVLAATKLQKAMRSKIARTAVAKMKMDDEKIEVPIPKPKKERKPRAPRTPKPVYKISYSVALKMWNASRGEAMYCNPRKGSPEYNEVQAMRL